MAELASKATDQAEESEAKVKALRLEKEDLLETFSSEKQELLAKLKELQEIIADKDQELKVGQLFKRTVYEKWGVNRYCKGLQCPILEKECLKCVLTFLRYCCQK